MRCYCCAVCWNLIDRSSGLADPADALQVKALFTCRCRRCGKPPPSRATGEQVLALRLRLRLQAKEVTQDRFESFGPCPIRLTSGSRCKLKINTPG
ncbi:uncharacterized protein J3R85_009179 [Psidium guajava]|nr:uncharacterized protein J3R85_009179 [Psidium guajava]